MRAPGNSSAGLWLQDGGRPPCWGGLLRQARQCSSSKTALPRKAARQSSPAHALEVVISATARKAVQEQPQRAARTSATTV